MKPLYFCLRGSDSNWRHLAYEASKLPTALPRYINLTDGTEIWTRVCGVKSRCPWPLDDTAILNTLVKIYYNRASSYYVLLVYYYATKEIKAELNAINSNQIASLYFFTPWVETHLT